VGASCRECVQFSRPSVAADRARADFIAGRFANGVAHSISKIEYRAMLGGNLSPTPTAKILFSQA
jgi:hypothetical protein